MGQYCLSISPSPPPPLRCCSGLNNREQPPQCARAEFRSHLPYLAFRIWRAGKRKKEKVLLSPSSSSSCLGGALGFVAPTTNTKRTYKGETHTHITAGRKFARRSDTCDVKGLTTFLSHPLVHTPLKALSPRGLIIFVWAQVFCSTCVVYTYQSVSEHLHALDNGIFDFGKNWPRQVF